MKLINHTQHLLLSALMFVLLTAGSSFAQTEAELVEAGAKAVLMLEQNRFKEAVPYLEKLVKAAPDDAEIHAAYGVALLFGSKQVDDPAEGKKMSDTALVELQAARNSVRPTRL